MVLKKKKCPPNPFPKGNKLAVGHGRPPSFTDAELDVIGKDLLAWMEKVDKENIEVVHLSEFYSELKDIARSDWWVLVERPGFSRYYDKARDWMAKKIMKNKELSNAYGSRYLNMYDKELREHERKQAEQKIDYELAKKAQLEANRSTAPNDKNLSELIKEIKNDRRNRKSSK